ncbi:hypothetical protein [Microvirga arsenatis]|uniref:hypothetical protein n=1 Tax=Microvirga arsenatis TaxID=2692265 RepID=UPI001FE6D86A|nr:hypothetical protein [Microvirga arsenatis]
MNFPARLILIGAGGCDKMVRAFLLLVTCVAFGSANAMEVRQTTWRGRPALLLTGPIERGDAEKLSGNLSGLPLWPHGASVLLLDSPGGSVGEALRISKLLDDNPVHTVIPKGAKCASACASIIFIAGKFRTVEEGGLFGQHSCSLRGVKDTECNHLIAQHAMAHGVSYGSVAAFVTYVPPSDIAWMERFDADCYGLTRYPFEGESGFERSEPCVIEAIAGGRPGAQAAWRVDFKADGYRAFLRPADDSKREMELSLFCSEARPGALFLSMDITGPHQMIREAVIGASLSAEPVVYQSPAYELVETGEGYSQVLVEILRKDVAAFLQKANKLVFTARLKKPYVDMVATTYLAKSRKALLFAANNCINGSKS